MTNNTTQAGTPAQTKTPATQSILKYVAWCKEQGKRPQDAQSLQEYSIKDQKGSFELMPKFSNVKSFYNKANITQNGAILTLKSYNTNILNYNIVTKQIIWLCNEKWAYTLTTNRHINEFLQQNNQPTLTKKEILKLAGVA